MGKRKASKSYLKHVLFHKNKSNTSSKFRLFSMIFAFAVVGVILLGQSQAGSSEVNISIKARGKSGDEMIQLRIKDEVVDSWTVGKNYRSYDYTHSESVNDKDIKVAFVNDSKRRNAWVDYISVNGETFQSEDVSVYSTGTWAKGNGCDDGYKQSEQLACNGYFHYSIGDAGQITNEPTPTPTPTEPPTNESVSLAIRARGRNGTERLELRIKDQTVDTWTVTTSDTLHSYTHNTSINDKDIKVAYVNDSRDRDVWVDYITVNEAKFQSEASTVFSTGTWSSDGGCSDDYKQSEKLSCNGHFLYAIGNAGQTSGGSSPAPAPDPAPTPEPDPDPAPDPAPSPTPTGNNILNVNFENQAQGEYTENEMDADFNWVGNWTSGFGQGRTNIAQEGDNNFLRLLFREGTRGHVQWQSDLGAQYQDIYAEYNVRFADLGNGFDFRDGGKLPGLAGGTAPTGGDRSSDGLGYTARFMWRNTSSNSTPYFTQYMYDMDKEDGRTGRHITLGGSPIYAEAGRWYTIKSRVVMNTPGQANGTIQAWLDGQMVLDIQDARLRSSSDLGTNLFYFSTFFGGSNSEQYQTSKDEYIDYDNFRVWTE